MRMRALSFSLVLGTLVLLPRSSAAQQDPTPTDITVAGRDHQHSLRRGSRRQIYGGQRPFGHTGRCLCRVAARPHYLHRRRRLLAGQPRR